jgi:hypothetical protein
MATVTTKYAIKPHIVHFSRLDIGLRLNVAFSCSCSCDVS